jgi:Predicted Zn-dependent protease (DUF2268)
MRGVLAFAFVLALAGGAPVRTTAQVPSVSAGHDPYGARLVTADIDRFWAVFDAPSRSADAFQHGYLDPATPGLRDFIPDRIGSAARLARTVAQHEAYYRAVRAPSQRARDFAPAIRRAFVRMHELYPDAVFPAVYFVVGALNSAGTVGDSGLIIGMDMSALPRPRDGQTCTGLEWQCANAASVEQLPFIVAHELTHIEQAAAHPEAAGTNVVPALLQVVLAEGVADYVAERATGIARTSEYVGFGESHAGEVRSAFMAVRGSHDPAAFREYLYGKPRAHPAWPQDLGYDIGYRIAKGYVARRGDERAAITELIRMDDAEKILAASGY